MHTVAYEGKTTPPSGVKRATGRPRTKHIRWQSLYAASADSPILCSNCGQAGHNNRTYSGKKWTKAPCFQLDANVVEATQQDEETKESVNELLRI